MKRHNGRYGLIRVCGCVAVILAVTSTAAVASNNIGIWSGSDRAWNDSDFTTIRNTMIGAGHTVEADGAITAANLANDDVFVIGEASSTPGAGELADLGAFVTGGGVLLLLADSYGTGVPGANGILSGIGSSLSFNSNSASSGALAGGIFATDGPPYNIVGQSLNVTPGSTALGGTTLAGGYLHYEKLGNGYIFAFGDRIDHDVFAPTGANVNGQLFLNIAAYEGDICTIPAPAGLLLASIGMGLVGWLRRHKTL